MLKKKPNRTNFFAYILAVNLPIFNFFSLPPIIRGVLWGVDTRILKIRCFLVEIEAKQKPGIRFRCLTLYNSRFVKIPWYANMFIANWFVKDNVQIYLFMKYDFLFLNEKNWEQRTFRDPIYGRRNGWTFLYYILVYNIYNNYILLFCCRLL